MVHIFVLRGDSHQRSKVVELFKDRRFAIYDHEYPSKLAASIALRQNIPGMPKARSEELSHLARRICNMLLSIKGPQQLTNDFIAWLRQQKADRILIVGVPTDSIWDGSVHYLLRRLQVTEVTWRMNDREVMNCIDQQVIRYEK